MEINKKTLIIAFICLYSYFWLYDRFSSSDFKEKSKAFFGKLINETTTHSFIEWSDQKKSQIVGMLSVGSGFILNLFPSIIRDPRKLIYPIGIATSGLFAKYNNIIDFGFYKIESKKPEKKGELKLITIFGHCLNKFLINKIIKRN